MPGQSHVNSLVLLDRCLQRFRPGQAVKCRVTGFRPLDGLAVLALKPSVVDQDIVSYAGAQACGHISVSPCLQDILCALLLLLYNCIAEAELGSRYT